LNLKSIIKNIVGKERPELKKEDYDMNRFRI
jgi:hypothetical protein